MPSSHGDSRETNAATKCNRRLEVLNEEFGFEANANSTAKKLRQYFDERTNEHAFIIAYREQRENAVKSALPPTLKVPAGKGSKKLLQPINMFAKQHC